MSLHWVVVAAPDRARVFSTDADWSHLALLDELVHPEARLKAAEILVHPHGTGPHTRPTHGAPPPIPGTDPLVTAHREFAHDLAERLREARTQGQLDRFVLVAPSSFLALVDANLDHDTAARRLRSIAHSWGNLPDDGIEAELRAVLTTT